MGGVARVAPSRGKLIVCSGHGPLQVNGKHKVPWEDVWIEWTGKPGRKKMRFGPTLVGYAELLDQIDFEKEMVAEYPDVEEYKRDLLDYEHAAKTLAVIYETCAIIDPKYRTTPNIYTSKRMIDRAEAEKMLGYYLRNYHGIERPRFKWKRARYVVDPMSFGVTAEDYE